VTAILLPRRAVPRSGAAREAARQLEALVHETVSSGAARQALLLRLSTLPRALAQPHHLRLAVEALEPLAAADRARLFLLPNHDAAIVWRGAAPAALAECRDRLRTLLADAPPGHGADAITRHLALPDQADTLLDAIAASLLPAPAPIATTPRAPLDLAALAALEAALARADLSRFARRRPVCALSPGAGLALAWEMRLFSLAELADTLAPDRDLKAAPWLFRRLTRTLDHRMMALLSAPQELHRAGPFGLALNIASLLSPAFLRFDAALPARLRGHVVIALRPDDLLADPPAFIFARGFAQARGYRLLLAGITTATAGAFPPEAIGIDHVQLAWQPGLATGSPALLGLPPARIVLAGTDTTAALDWARAQGIPWVSGALARQEGKHVLF
jgi:hypothetical protein